MPIDMPTDIHWDVKCSEGSQPKFSVGLSVDMSVDISNHVSVDMRIIMSVHLSIDMSTDLPIVASVDVPIDLSTDISVGVFVDMSIDLPVNLSINLFITLPRSRCKWIWNVQVHAVMRLLIFLQCLAEAVLDISMEELDWMLELPTNSSGKSSRRQKFMSNGYVESRQQRHATGSVAITQGRFGMSTIW